MGDLKLHVFPLKTMMQSDYVAKLALHYIALNFKEAHKDIDHTSTLFIDYCKTLTVEQIREAVSMYLSAFGDQTEPDHLGESLHLIDFDNTSGYIDLQRDMRELLTKVVEQS